MYALCHHYLFQQTFDINEKFLAHNRERRGQGVKYNIPLVWLRVNVRLYQCTAGS